MTTHLSVRSALRRALAIATVASLFASPVSADTKAELDAARQRLSSLESQISAQEAEIDRLQARLGDLLTQVGRQQGVLGEVRAELGKIQRQHDATRKRLGEIRTGLAARARQVYMHGPVQLLDVVLGARDATELTARIAYAGRVMREDSRLALEAERLKAELAAERAEREALAEKERKEFEVLDGRRRDLQSVVARQIRAIDEVARTRAQTLDLVNSLEDKLDAELLAGARTVAGKGMPITFGQWAESFLPALGAPASRNNLVVVVAWEVSEYTRATWNPLATTYGMPGATRFNSHGVRNYVSKEQGIEATIKTVRLFGHGYEKIVANLVASSRPMTTAEAINASDWCRGCAGGHYVTGIVEAVEEYYEDYANR